MKRFTSRTPARLINTWWPFKISQTLQHHAKDTLEELDLTSESSKKRVDLPLFDGLQAFQVLKKLRVRYNSIMSASEEGTFSAAPLTSILPSSLEELRLIGRDVSGYTEYLVASFEEMKRILRNDLNRLTKLFDGLPELKEECLPNLVIIESENAYYGEFENSGSYQQIREACIRAGLALDGLPWGSQPVRGRPPPLTP